MSVATEPAEHELHDEKELRTRLAQYELTTSSGKPDGKHQCHKRNGVCFSPLMDRRLGGISGSMVSHGACRSKAGNRKG